MPFSTSSFGRCTGIFVKRKWDPANLASTATAQEGSMTATGTVGREDVGVMVRGNSTSVEPPSAQTGTSQDGSASTSSTSVGMADAVGYTGDTDGFEVVTYTMSAPITIKPGTTIPELVWITPFNSSEVVMEIQLPEDYQQQGSVMALDIDATMLVPDYVNNLEYQYALSRFGRVLDIPLFYLVDTSFADDVGM